MNSLKTLRMFSILTQLCEKLGVKTSGDFTRTAKDSKCVAPGTFERTMHVSFRVKEAEETSVYFVSLTISTSTRFEGARQELFLTFRARCGNESVNQSIYAEFKGRYVRDGRAMNLVPRGSRFIDTLKKPNGAIREKTWVHTMDERIFICELTKRVSDFPGEELYIRRTEKFRTQRPSFVLHVIQ